MTTTRISRSRRLLVFGSGGQVGQALLQTALPPDLSMTGFDHRDIDITDTEQVEAAIADQGGDLIVNAAAYTAVDRAESEPQAAFAVNRDGPAHLAAACARHRLPLIHLSTDYVFDGRRGGAWREDDVPAPLGVYGASKLAGEQAVRARLPQHVIIRTSWVYSATGQNFVKTMLRLGEQRSELRVVADQSGCPTAAADIAKAIVVVAQAVLVAPATARYGTYHYCGRGETTWYQFAVAIFRLARAYRGTSPDVIPIDTSDYPTPARRPANSVLDCTRIEHDYLIERPLWSDSLAQVIAELHQA
jgi:dTDP-4-dehydrorhamnose reductase